MENNHNWVELKKNANTGIETLCAHFTGHAYDPHWHSTYSIGLTNQGTQQFSCRRKLINSHKGQVFMLDPEEIHDGHAIEHGGFTYQVIYIEPEWLHHRVHGLFDNTPQNFEFSVDTTLTSDPHLANAVALTFNQLHYQESKILVDCAIDFLLKEIFRTQWVKAAQNKLITPDPVLAIKIKNILDSHITVDLGLVELGNIVGIDRFTINRIFKKQYHISPHQYLVQMRLNIARTWLANGKNLADVALELCFSDQSHFCRWFKRCYGVTPAKYKKIVTAI